MDTHKLSLKPLWQDFIYFNHQPAAIEWMMTQEEIGQTIRGVKVFGGILGDEMGLGKTIEVAGLIKNRPVRNTLILAPLAVIGTWISVLRRAGGTVWAVERGNWWCQGAVRAGPQIYITNLDKLHGSPALFRRQWDRVIIDEAHKIRNTGSALFRACRALEARSRWALTATPVVNGMQDVFALYAFLRVPVMSRRWQPIMESWTAKLVFHRSLNELRATLPDAPPEPVIHRLICPFETHEEAEFYYGIQGLIADKIEKYSMDSASNAEIFKLLLRLRQISVHPQVYINALRREYKYMPARYERDDWKGAATKFQAVDDLLAAGTGKTIIVCHFKDEIDLLAEFIEEKGRATAIYKYSGENSIEERDQIVKDATAGGDGTVILLQLQAGGVGINLQTFNRVIFMTPWWNAALVDQAIGRAVRMGQKAVVQVYHILFEAEEEMSGIMIDRFMESKVEAKRALLEQFWASAVVKVEDEHEKEVEEEQEEEDPVAT
jgi:SNF2 family DNA or RNA helicase